MQLDYIIKILKYIYIKNLKLFIKVNFLFNKKLIRFTKNFKNFINEILIKIIFILLILLILIINFY